MDVSHVTLKDFSLSLKNSIYKDTCIILLLLVIAIFMVILNFFYLFGFVLFDFDFFFAYKTQTEEPIAKFPERPIYIKCGSLTDDSN